jgi:hypothetical protein
MLEEMQYRMRKNFMSGIGRASRSTSGKTMTIDPSDNDRVHAPDVDSLQKGVHPKKM